MATPAVVTNTTTGRSATPTLVASIAGFVVMVMGIAGLAGAYGITRFYTKQANPTEQFFAKSMKFNNYAAFIVLFSLALGSLAVGWAVTSVKVGNRRWSAAGFGIAIVTNLAALNIIWFIGSEWKAAANAAPWWLHTYALLTFAVIACLVGLVSCVAGLARVTTGQATADQPHQAMAASWLQHGALVVWIVVYSLIYLYK
jgi:heme/copper-type cytochrome/quinol oxidase subunit 3